MILRTVVCSFPGKVLTEVTVVLSTGQHFIRCDVRSDYKTNVCSCPGKVFTEVTVVLFQSQHSRRCGMLCSVDTRVLLPLGSGCNCNCFALASLCLSPRLSCPFGRFAAYISVSMHLRQRGNGRKRA